MNALCLPLLLALATPQDPVEKIFYLDYSSGERVANMEVETTAAVFNPQDKASIVFMRPGASGLVARFDLPALPTRAELELTHLSSGANVEFGGNSRIAIRCTFPLGTDLEGQVELTEGEGSYAVVVSRRTFADPAWKRVVTALKARHRASLVVYPSSVRSTTAALAEVFPRHVCFVVRPEEAGRAFVIAVHRLTRALDDDPYTDVQWAILTGYDADDALRIARHDEPLRVRRVAAGCGVDLGAFHEGAYYSEGEQGAMWRREPGGEAEKLECEPDTTRLLVDELNDGEPGFFVTSGHATHRDWQIGYSYKNGQFRCKDGELFGLDIAGERFEIDSPNPKIYCGVGNCLIGLIADRQTMALAWMHSGGAYQMLGYVVSTWYGYGARGVNDIFIQQQGRFTFAEAFYLNNQALVHQLVTRFPDKAEVDFERWNIEADHDLPNKLARENGLRDRDAVGLLWDRDTVVLYGDPAWDARVDAVREPAWQQSLEEEDGSFRFEIEVPDKPRFSRPPMALLPYRIGDVEITRGAELEPVITDNFILLPVPAGVEPGTRLVVCFTGSRI